MSTQHSGAPSLVTLLIRVTRHPLPRWPSLTDRPAIVRAMEAAAEDPAELQALRACYPDPVLRELRLRRLAQAFEVPDSLVLRLLARLAALPPRMRFPESPDLRDWAWDRRRELFGR